MHTSFIKRTSSTRTDIKSSTFKARNIGKFIARYPYTSLGLTVGLGTVFLNHTLFRKNIVPQAYPNSVTITFSDPPASQYSSNPDEDASKGKVRFKGWEFRPEVKLSWKQFKQEAKLGWDQFSSTFKRDTKAAVLKLDRGIIQPALAEGAASARVRLDSATNALNDM
jgi:hypothetical protein